MLRGKIASANQEHYPDLSSDDSSLRSFLRNVFCLLTPGFVAGFCLAPPALAIRLSSKLNGEMSKSYGILYRWKYVFLYHSLHKKDWIIVWSHLFATQSFCSKQTSFPVCRFLRSVRALTPLRREILQTRFVGLSDEPLVHYNAKKFLRVFLLTTVGCGNGQLLRHNGHLQRKECYWTDFSSSF